MLLLGIAMMGYKLVVTQFTQSTGGFAALSIVFNYRQQCT